MQGSIALPLAIVIVLAIIATVSAQAQTFTVLHRFNGKYGRLPYGGVIRDAKGNLYGTTALGGRLPGRNSVQVG
jgi:hypothetical protein